ncbi:hypothetical protein [Streptomyces anulatus]|uniref:hypothetical protein n=1 Tax=Streptomyces anulatus TaxID=1892 RepID=UPI00131F1D98|nr:hypothetical protein [Streptomyces anulatus]WTC61251.1 hypothetical protein OG865_01420 [Streptomyces anulatus]
MKISSPSKVTQQLGLFTGQGFEGGVWASIPGAARAAAGQESPFRFCVSVTLKPNGASGCGCRLVPERSVASARRWNTSWPTPGLHSKAAAGIAHLVRELVRVAVIADRAAGAT